MEFIDVLRYFGALLLVLAMVGGAGLLARRFGVPGVTKATAIKRLAVVETLMVGPRQRLFIVRRDHVEHLVMSSPDGVSVIESGIMPSPAGLRGASMATSPTTTSHAGEASP
ncbi:MAG TPA: flagellar biosynthetic protein FliO [Rhizomicrobium sp.]|nr:flagellar biosynthetic protein FliO [Rhizomicrobium sp.]